MAEWDESADGSDQALARIEAALDRIAQGSPQPDAFSIPEPSFHTDTTIIAARLDGLIAYLRDTLAIAAS